MKKAIIGSGGFGREVKSMLLDNKFDDIIDFFVEDEFVDENSFPLSSLNTQIYEIVVAISNPLIRKKIIDKLPKDTKFFKAIHKSVIFLEKNILIGDGAIICPNVIITNNVKIGNHCHLNLLTTIGHDTVIGDFFTSAPGAKISGNCTIGNKVYVGTNASIKEKINICDEVTIGLNTGVVKDINEKGIYGGVPAKKIK